MMTRQQSSKVPNLRVATLNIWAIPLISKDVEKRIKSLIASLNEDEPDFDIIALQEVWSYDDYLNIKESIKKRYPYSHHFKSGLVGSGCCIFSKHFIEDVFHHPFTLNGYPHKIQHADWFAGKLVGLAKVRYRGLSVNVYTTHLHANYSERFKEDQYSDEYLAHRMAQLFELSQFIKETSSAADMTLLMGDLNTEEFEIGYKLLVQHASLSDAFIEKSKTVGMKSLNGMTCHLKENCYQTSQSIQKAFPDGIRIDYILFRSNNKSTLRAHCVDCDQCFGKINPYVNGGLNYSDHEGVYAEFSLLVLDKKESHQDKSEENLAPYEQVKAIIEKSQGNLFKYQLAYAFMALVLLFLVPTLNNEALLGSFICFVVNFVSWLVISYLIIHVVFIKTAERNHLHYTSTALDVAMNARRLQDFKKID